MLRFASRLTRAPGEMEQGDVRRLREAGHGDAEILAITEVAAYYAYVNRIAVALGVELEE